MAETYYVRTDGAATNGGSSNAASPKVAATTATTNGTTFTKVGAQFQTNGVTATDTVNITAGAGVTPGIYGIASITDEDNVELDAAPGNSVGDVTGNFGGAWTPQQGADQTTAGDVCYWIGGTYTLTAAIDFDTNSGSSGTPTLFVRHIADGAVVIDADNTAANCFTSDKTLIIWDVDDHTTDSWELKNATGDGWDANTAGSQFVWRNLRINNCGGDGFDGFRIKVKMYNCSFDNNTLMGYNDRVSTSFGDRFFFSKFHDNAQHGLNHRTTDPVLFGCEFYDNTTKAMDVVYNEATILNNTFYGNGNGIQNDTNTVHSWMFINNIIKGHNGAGDIGYDGNANHVWAVVDNNCWHDNTSDVNNITKGNKAVNADPDFVSVTDGSEDFNLNAGSPCIGTGEPFTGGPGVINSNLNIGAHQTEAGGETSHVWS